MTRLTERLISGRFPGPRDSKATRETELPEQRSAAWRRRFLAEADRSGQDVWLYGYGSLLWSGEMRAPESRLATVYGWHRRFCLLQWAWRGDLHNPCLMLALDRGGCSEGLVYRVPGPRSSDALRDIWDREMSGDGYRPRWVKAHTRAGKLRALTFVVNRDGERYAGRLSDEQAAHVIASACGETGACAEYLRRTVRALERHGLRDHHLARLERLVAVELGVHS